MKKLLVLFVPLLMFLILFAQEPVKDVTVNWIKKPGLVEYSILFNPDYKINLKAPFNFMLLDSEKKQLSKVDWNSFVKDGNDIYKYSSKGSNEKFVKYWFVACRHQNNEVVSCKTFSQTVEIK